MRIRTRFLLLVVLLVLTLFAVMLQGQNALLHDHLSKTQERWIYTTVRGIAEVVAQDVIDSEARHASELLGRIVSQEMAIDYIYVTDFDGRLFAHSFPHGFPKRLVPHLNVPNDKNVLKSASRENQIYEVIVPLIEGMHAFLYIGVVNAEIQEVMARARAELLAIISGIAILGLVITLLIGVRLSRPLQALSEQIQRYGQDGGTSKVDIDTSEPDINTVVVAFNDALEARSSIENELRENEARFKDFAESSSDWFWEVDANLRLTYLSHGREDPLGLDVSNFVGQTIAEIAGQAFVNDDDGAGLTALEPRQSFRDVIVNVRGLDEKNHVIRINGVPLLHADGSMRGYRGTATDITEQRRLESQLTYSAKMQSIGELSGGLAHDFNNILGIVQGNLEILRLRAGDNPDLERQLEAALKGVARGANLTQNLLGFSRHHQYKRQSLSINTEILGLEELIRKSLTNAIDVRLELAEDLWKSEIDSGDFSDSLINLVLNSRDAMSGEGRLTIRTQNVTLPEGHSFLNEDCEPGDYVELEVTDTGSGISAGAIDRIFEPFFSTKPRGKGTGLGLSMVFGFIKRSQGDIFVSSSSDSGARFQIYLPRSDGEAGRSTHSGDVHFEELRGTETILMVDDEQGLLDVGEHSLRELGYEVLLAHDGGEALGIASNREDIDLVFSDVLMPGEFDGFALALRVHEIKPEPKVLLTSGYLGKFEHRMEVDGVDGDLVKQLSAGLLRKPYSQHQMAFAIRKLLDGDP